MPTIQEEKPARPRARSRKADQRGPKGGRQQVEVKAETESKADPVNATVAETQFASIEAVPSEVAHVEVAQGEVPTVDVAPAVAMETAPEVVLSGEVLPPAIHLPGSQGAGLQALAQAQGEYARKSWLDGRVLVERLIASRSFDEAIEIQGEFAKQAYANLLTHSQQICVLYGEWVQQFLRPLEKLATEWPRIGR